MLQEKQSGSGFVRCGPQIILGKQRVSRLLLCVRENLHGEERKNTFVLWLWGLVHAERACGSQRVLFLESLHLGGAHTIPSAHTTASNKPAAAGHFLISAKKTAQAQKARSMQCES
jgi:hypothetical protein